MALPPPDPETLVEAHWSADGLQCRVRTEASHPDPLTVVLMPLSVWALPLLPCVLAASVWDWGPALAMLYCASGPVLTLPAMVGVALWIARRGRPRRVHLSPRRLTIAGLGSWDLTRIRGVRAQRDLLILEGPRSRTLVLGGTPPAAVAWLADQIRRASSAATDRGAERDIDPDLGDPAPGAGPGCPRRSEPIRRIVRRRHRESGPQRPSTTPGSSTDPRPRR